MYSFSYLEPVCCSMSSSNCCFLTCVQISQEIFSRKDVKFYHMFSLPLLRCLCHFSPSLCCCVALLCLVCGCRATLASHGWIPLDLGAPSLWRAAGFSLLVFCWGFSHLCSSGLLAAVSLWFCSFGTLVWLSYRWCWPCKMNLNVFPSLWFFGRVQRGLVLILF